MIENSMCNDITSDSFDLDQKLYAKEQELIRIDYKEKFNIKNYRSTLIIGNMQINNIKHFNWFQKLMWKLFLGIKIIDLEKSDKDE